MKDFLGDLWRAGVGLAFALGYMLLLTLAWSDAS